MQDYDACLLGALNRQNENEQDAMSREPAASELGETDAGSLVLG